MASYSSMLLNQPIRRLMIRLLEPSQFYLSILNKGKQMTTTANKTKLIQEYATKVFDGVFSSEEIASHRARVFYRLANFTSAKSNKKLSEVLTQDEIGEIINELDTIQFNRRLQARVTRAGEAQF